MNSKPPRRAILELVGAIIGTIVALLTALALIGKVRAVDVVALFAGGFAAGAGLVGALTKFRAARGPAA